MQYGRRVGFTRLWILALDRVIFPAYSFPVPIHTVVFGFAVWLQCDWGGNTKGACGKGERKEQKANQLPNDYVQHHQGDAVPGAWISPIPLHRTIWLWNHWTPLLWRFVPLHVPTLHPKRVSLQIALLCGMLLQPAVHEGRCNLPSIRLSHERWCSSHRHVPLL